MPTRALLLRVATGATAAARLPPLVWTAPSPCLGRASTGRGAGAVAASPPPECGTFPRYTRVGETVSGSLPVPIHDAAVARVAALALCPVREGERCVGGRGECQARPLRGVRRTPALRPGECVWGGAWVYPWGASIAWGGPTVRWSSVQWSRAPPRSALECTGRLSGAPWLMLDTLPCSVLFVS